MRGMNDYAANGGDLDASYNGMIRSWHSPALRLILAHVPDGLSNTILVSEKWRSHAGLRAPTWGDDQGMIAGYDANTVRGGQTGLRRDDVAISFGPLDQGGFGSAHPVALNALFADVSVRQIRYGVDPAFFQQLCIRNDGLPVTLDDL
jgi:hypothetical protein